jgi:hypothetical protein
VHDVVAAIEDAEPAMRGRVTVGDEAIVGPVEVDEAALAATVGPVRWRPVSEGVRDTIATLRAAVERGVLDPDAVRRRLEAEAEPARAGT